MRKNVLSLRIAEKDLSLIALVEGNQNQFNNRQISE